VGNQYLIKRFLTIAGLAGLIAPIAFVFCFFLQGLLRSDYNPLSMYISVLSIGPYGWVQILNFIVFGILLALFTLRVIFHFRNGKAAKSGPIVLFISALCFLLSGPFVMDPMGNPIYGSTPHSLVHGILGAIVFLLMPITCFVYWGRFRADKEWNSMKIWTQIMAIVITLCLVVFTIVTKNSILEYKLGSYVGIFQRSVIVPYMIWLFTFAIAINRRNLTTG